MVTLAAAKTKVELDRLCHSNRIKLIDMLYNSQSGHLGGSLSACELLTALYNNIMEVDPSNPDWEDRDRLILSKGHCSPMAYIVMAELGYFPKSELEYFRKAGHMLQGHPSRTKVPGADYTAGPLGLGLSFATGVALNAKLEGKDYYTYTLLGDGELQEGCIWEGFFTLSKYNLTNLITIIDNNQVQLDGTNNEIMPMGSIKDKITAFGCNVIKIDGHNCAQIQLAVKSAQLNQTKPTVIIAKTVKGKGVSFMEGDCYWHGASLDKESCKLALAELKGEDID